jgi:hypothetical protein
MTALAAKGGLFSISGRQWLILLMVQLEILRQAAMIGYLNAFYLMAFHPRGDAACRLHAPDHARPVM